MTKLLIVFAYGLVIGLCWGVGIRRLFVLCFFPVRLEWKIANGLIAVALIGGGIIIALAFDAIYRSEIKSVILTLQNIMFG